MSLVIVPDDGGDPLTFHDVGGIVTPAFGCPKQAEEVFKRLPEFPVREDDLMLCTYIKTGMKIKDTFPLFSKTMNAS